MSMDRIADILDRTLEEVQSLRHKRYYDEDYNAHVVIEGELWAAIQEDIAAAREVYRKATADTRPHSAGAP